LKKARQYFARAERLARIVAEVRTRRVAYVSPQETPATDAEAEFERVAKLLNAAEDWVNERLRPS
jgi:hypothetical protein